MVDVWLLFNVILPFILVLIHTYMDYLREEEEREINHHGKTITVDNAHNFVSYFIDQRRKMLEKHT